jgi:EAL domain-containing protein (putative c-di-GMP-specific phosphodiesterase class I)
LKIDRSFITNILSGSGDYPLLTFMIDLAHKLGKTVVAEGVEDKVQRDKLCELGVDFIQGYFYAKPMPANAIEPFIKIKR